LRETLLNLRQGIQKAHLMYTTQRTEKKEISDPGIREAMRETLIGFSLHPKVFRRNK